MIALENINCINCKARSQSIFEGLNNEELKLLESIKNRFSIKKGESLFTEGVFPKGLYCLNEGKIKLSQIGFDGKEQIVHLAHDGDILGYRALFGEDQYSCSAMSIEHSKVCFIPKSQFYNFVKNNAKLLIKIANLLSEELKQAERKITITAQQPVKDRVAQCLLVLIKNYGYEKDNSTINIVVKRQEIAGLSGTTRETATRILYQLKSNKIIDLIQKKIKILDLNKLKEIANNL